MIESVFTFFLSLNSCWTLSLSLSLGFCYIFLRSSYQLYFSQQYYYGKISEKNVERLDSKTENQDPEFHFTNNRFNYLHKKQKS